MDIEIIRKKRELAYKGTILKVYKDYININGHDLIWDFIHHDGAAAVVAIDDEGKLIMVRQYRNALDRYTLEIPAGKVDNIKEDRILCGYRELEEETGMRVKNINELKFLIRINTTVAFCDEEIDIFVANNLEKSKQHLDEDEYINVEHWKLEDLLSMIYNGKLKDAKTVAAILAYANKYNKL